MRYEDQPGAGMMRCHHFYDALIFRRVLNASPLPLFQAAPGFFSVGRRADRRNDDGPPAEKKHTPCEGKVYRKGTRRVK